MMQWTTGLVQRTSIQTAICQEAFSCDSSGNMFSLPSSTDLDERDGPVSIILSYIDPRAALDMNPWSEVSTVTPLRGQGEYDTSLTPEHFRQFPS